MQDDHWRDFVLMVLITIVMVTLIVMMQTVCPIARVIRHDRSCNVGMETMMMVMGIQTVLMRTV